MPFDTALEYSIRVVAEGYNDAVFNITILPLLAVPEYVAFEQDGQTINMGTQLDLVFGIGSAVSDYGNAMKKVIINDVEYEVSNVNKYDISSNVNVGENTITLKAAEYEYKVFTVTMNPVSLEAVPELVSVYHNYSNLGHAVDLEGFKALDIMVKNYRISADYKNAITAINVENVNGTANKTVIASNETPTIDTFRRNDRLTINKDWLALGLNTITLSSEGYDDYTCKITVTPLSAPSSVGIYNGTNGKLAETSCKL